MRRPTRAEPTPDGFLRVTDVAKQLNVTRQHVYNMINRGDLQAVKIGGATRVPAHVLKAYVDAAYAAAGI